MKSNFKAIKQIVKQLNYILNSQQKKMCIWVFLSMLLSSVLELVGVTAIYPFMDILLDPQALDQKWYLKILYNLKADITVNEIIIIVGIVIVLIYLLKNVVMLASVYLQNYFAAKLDRELSTLMLKSFLRRPYQFFLNTNSSIILRGIGSDVAGVYKIIVSGFELISSLLTVTLLGVFLTITDYTMAIGALALAATCLIAVVVGFKGKMKKAGREIRVASAKKSEYAYQAVCGIKEITVADRIDSFARKYEEAAIVNQHVTLINGFINACPKRIIEGVCIGGFMVIACIKVVMGTDMQTFVPKLGMFAMAAFKILPAVSGASSQLNSIVFYKQHLQGTYENLKAANDYIAEVNRNAYANRLDDTEELRFMGSVKIDNVTWKYQNAKDNVLQDLSLQINKGESVAFIGASGAGKTTLADIIMGLLPPQEGKVKMDGIDIFSIKHQWARTIGYVPQAVFLIDDTIRNNVAFGMENDEISDAKVWRALEQAQLKEFVTNLPLGLDTIVGERGIKFSGGQRQRVAIARALYENPDILVFDEATSALDSETEEAVMQSIDALQGQVTLIIVAHRLTTIKNCDKIYEIKEGKAILRDKQEVLSGI